jgi:hypothetical protein
MPRVGFKHTISASARAKTVHALDRSATVTGISYYHIKFHEPEVLAKASGYMGLVKKATEIKLHTENINREKGSKLSKAWNHSTSLLRHSNIHTS